ncbi:Adenovirus E3 region protein CR2, putative [Angomonas deanei]|uniref:Adenovirus E3 region protein CR2, putative n=1 Tax=Angomonas deanei TaxID=59799 RepID=A0A7G2CNA4_9TRYP|nr:Adenovirus E3 region protein CR2, putative [Angomonas deanei]
MVCQVANCTKCVDDTEDQCGECEGDLVVKGSVCGAKENDGGLPVGAIIGIVVGVVVLLALLLLLLLFFCCRKRKTARENVEHNALTKSEEEMTQQPKVDVTEETEVTMLTRPLQDGSGDGTNPLSEPPKTDEEVPQTGERRRRGRRTRSVRNAGAEIADIDLDYMYNNNEIVED